MTYVTDTLPKLGLVLLGYGAPGGKFLPDVLGAVFGGLIPQPKGPDIQQVVLMAVHQLEDFIRDQFDDTQVREGSAHIKTTYDWFKETFDAAKVDKDAVTAGQASFMGQLDDALGPNSFLDLGINTLSDPRYRYLGITMLCTGIGLKCTLYKIRMQVRNDRSPIGGIIEQIQNYKDTLEQAKQEAEMYGFRQLEGLNGAAFISRRDELVQQLCQGDASVTSEAAWHLDRAVDGYTAWASGDR
jgi:hypothetical protein